VVPLVLDGLVEGTRIPQNPLDVLAQQIVATVASSPTTADAVLALVRRAAPFSELARRSFETVLDMLSGRYPSDQFSGLRPLVTWDRTSGALRAREGAKRIAIQNGGTIPDRGLYGVYLGDDDTCTGSARAGSRRVGELDEEMVFESRVGEVFLLGATSWRITEITHDRVIVVPAPGVPGKMPFWKGERPGRSLPLGTAIGALARTLAEEPPAVAVARLERHHHLDHEAATSLVAYVKAELEATGEVPSDETIVIERYTDEVGDLRVVVCCPLGSKVLTALCLALLARLRAESSQDIEGVATDDGIFFRFPGWDTPPDLAALFPDADEMEEVVLARLPSSGLFAAHFRENAGRALLLPRRRPGARAPLWATRKKAADLLAIAGRYRSFPIVLETIRECARDVLDLPGLAGVLRKIEQKTLRVVTVDVPRPSPFASSILFSYIGYFLYDGDAPLAERRAAALTIDTSELGALLGEGELSELLQPDAILELERFLQHQSGRRPVTHPDGLHDLLLDLGDLTEDEIRERTGAVPSTTLRSWIASLSREGRIAWLSIAGSPRWVAVEDVARFRDALGTAIPPGIPSALLDAPADPLGDLLGRFARTHGPFRLDEVMARFGLARGPARAGIEALEQAGRVVEGRFRRGASEDEHCDADVLRHLKRKSLDKLRREVEPVSPAALSRFLLAWQGVEPGGSRRSELSERMRRAPPTDALLAVIDKLQGAPLLASALETSILPARLPGYMPSDLDALCARGDVTWMGLGAHGPRDAKIALFLAGQVDKLAPPPSRATGEHADRVRRVLADRGALFFVDLAALLGGFAPETLAALWELVLAGEITNDTLVPLRSYLRPMGPPMGPMAFHRRDRRGARRTSFGLPPVFARSGGLPGSEGRWSLIRRSPNEAAASETERRTALTAALLRRHGVLTREAVLSEGISGGFSSIYPVLRGMEEAGRIRRGYFVEGLAATQFAEKGADERLRSLREPTPGSRPFVLAATDPANAYGAALLWPASAKAEPSAPGPERAAGAHVILLDGELIAYVGRREKQLVTFIPSDSERVAEAVARGLCDLVDNGTRRGLLLERIDGGKPAASGIAACLKKHGFFETEKGYARRPGIG
jgi:ATP-dependent Lhr-like helicase